jgi:hypothetical protein
MDDHDFWMSDRGSQCLERGCRCRQFRHRFTGQRGSEAGCYG